MKSFDYTIQDAEGVHARPAGILCKACKGMKPNKVTLTRGEDSIDCTKLLALMSLGIKCGETVTFTVEGPEEEETAAQLLALLQEHL